MKAFLIEQYDGECPDCGNDDLNDIDHECGCHNCGHVFYDEEFKDEGLIVD